MSMGRGTIHCRSSKQKLNTKSSTEAEIVGMSDYIPYNIWLANFMKGQGYEIKNNVVYQDNQSAMKMEINGRTSCTGNSRHIDIRYFFTKDRIDKGEMTIEYCPTHRMLADFFTKPLQGKLFRMYRDVIMGYRHISELSSIDISTIKERVGNQENVTDEMRNEKSKKLITDQMDNGRKEGRSYAEVVRASNRRFESKKQP
jgi:hypothetical protein